MISLAVSNNERQRRIEIRVWMRADTVVATETTWERSAFFRKKNPVSFYYSKSILLNRYLYKFIN